MTIPKCNAKNRIGTGPCRLLFGSTGLIETIFRKEGMDVETTNCYNKGMTNRNPCGSPNKNPKQTMVRVSPGPQPTQGKQAKQRSAKDAMNLATLLQVTSRCLPAFFGIFCKFILNAIKPFCKAAFEG